MCKFLNQLLSKSQPRYNCKRQRNSHFISISNVGVQNGCASLWPTII